MSSFNLRAQMSPDSVRDKNGNLVSESHLQGKIIGLYFSAHWCPPCRAFTPMLVKKYNEIKATHDNFEIIFISCDHDEESCMSYYESMPWMLVKYQGTAAERRELMNKYSVRGIPALVLFDSNGELISAHGRQLILSEPFDKLKEAEEERAKAWCTIS